MPTYREVIRKLEGDTGKCNKWLAAIKAFFRKEEELFMRYRNELMKVGRAIKNSNALRGKANAKKTEAACMRIELLLAGMRNLSKKIVKAARAEEEVTVADEEDFDKVSHGVKEEYYKAIVYTIHSDLRAAFVELRKLITLTGTIDDLISAEIGRVHEIAKLARKASKGYSEELVIQARQHIDEKYPWMEKEKKTPEEEEEIRKKIAGSLNSAVMYFRAVMEVGEELAEEERAEFEEIAKISAIETKLRSAEAELRRAA